MKRIMQTLRQAHIILRARFLAALPTTAGSHVPAQKSSGTTINLSDLSPDASGTGWTYGTGEKGGYAYTIDADADVTVTGATGSGAANSRYIMIAANATATLTLSDATITNTSTCYDKGAITIGSGATLTLILADGTDNSLTGVEDWPAIAVTNATATLIIQGNGRLTARGGNYAAGIGGSSGSNVGTIDILGGTIEATGGEGGAGIGSGYNGGFFDGSGITVSGGTVTANGGNGGAGIGSGYNGGFFDGGGITVSGGTVTANGGNGGAGIGSGQGGDFDGGGITVSGGSINANSISVQPKAEDGTPVYLNTLKVGSLSAVTPVTAGVIGSTGGSETPSGGSYGIRDVETDASGKVYFYLPATGGRSETVMLGTSTAYYSDTCERTAAHTNTAALTPTSSVVAFVLEGTDGKAQAPYDFGSLEYGYDTPPAALTVTVRNTGDVATGALTVTGTDGGSRFTFSPDAPGPIDSPGSTSFTVQPQTKLDAGTYTDTVKVKDAGGTGALFAVRFTVTRRAVTVSGGTVTPKTYDGTPGATVTGQTFDFPLANEELEPGTDYTVSASCDNADAGDAKTVTVTVKLNATAKADNYNLTGRPYTLTGVITRAVPTADDLDV